VHRVRGESGRVAARVRDLLNQQGAPDAAARAGPSRPNRTPGIVQRLAARVPVRLDPGRRAALAVGAAVLVAAVLTGWWLLASRPRSVAVSSAPAPLPGATSPVGSAQPSPAPSAASSAPASTSAAPLVVDVAGKVRRPGLYRLPDGARVDDAIKAAGGPLHGVNLISLNLAAKVADGQQILVGVRGAGAGPVGAVGSPSEGTAGAAPVDLNTATLEQLEALPGVGPVLGQNILDWRSAHGSFSSVDQLNDVTGIGAVKFAALRPLVTV
jgi:competence protein ComEA